MSFTRAIIAGAGLSGLSAAVSLRQAGIAVQIADAAAQAGGRCRSYHDGQLDLVIDNGNHLVLSGNSAVARFREAVGAGGALEGPPHADFTFRDLETGKSWTVAINDGALPWWVFSPSRRVPETGPGDYLPLLRLLSGGGGTIGDRITPSGPVWDRLLEPVLLAALNTAPADSSLKLASAVLRETVARGGRAMRPLIATPGLSAAFIDPALSWLGQRSSPVTLGRRLRAITFAGDRVTGLDWADGVEAVSPDDAVVLAVPPWVASRLVPGLTVPEEMRAIVNAHFAIAAPSGAPRMLGLLGGTAEWLFAFPDRISVTVSAADRLIDEDREALALRFWGDICAAYGIDAPLPRWQIVKEKRATFAATPDQDALRPGAATRWRNLFLAGDWTATGLPATIEGALRSGETAARLVVAAKPR